MRNGGNLLHLKVMCCSLYSHYNKISLADKKYPSCICIMTLLIKTKDKKPSFPRKGGAGMKIRNYVPKSLLLNEYSPIHFHTPYNQLAKKTQGS